MSENNIYEIIKDYDQDSYSLENKKEESEECSCEDCKMKKNGSILLEEEKLNNVVKTLLHNYVSETEKIIINYGITKIEKLVLTMCLEDLVEEKDTKTKYLKILFRYSINVIKKFIEIYEFCFLLNNYDKEIDIAFESKCYEIYQSKNNEEKISLIDSDEFQNLLKIFTECNLSINFEKDVL